jgi:hypothetical protein
MRLFLWIAGIAAAFGLRLPQATIATLREGADQLHEFDQAHPEYRDRAAQGFNVVQRLATIGGIAFVGIFVPPVIGFLIARYSPWETLAFLGLVGSAGLSLICLAVCFLSWGPLFWGVAVAQRGARRVGNWMDDPPKPINIKAAPPAAAPTPTGGKT